MTDWKQHWNTKTTVKEFWHPIPVFETDDLYELGFAEGHDEGYIVGWNEALEEVKSSIWHLEK